MRRQAERWGAELFLEDVEHVDVKNSPFTVESSERKVICIFIGCSFMYLYMLKLFHFCTEVLASYFMEHLI